MANGSGVARLALAVVLLAAELTLLVRYYQRTAPPRRAAGVRRCEAGHLVLGAAMIGMLEPALNVLPPIGWSIVLGGSSVAVLRPALPFRVRPPRWLPGPDGLSRDARHLVLSLLGMAYLMLALPMRMPGVEQPLRPLLTGPGPVAQAVIGGYVMLHAAVVVSRAFDPVRRSCPQPPATGPLAVLAAPRVELACQFLMDLAMLAMTCWPTAPGVP